MRGVESTPSTCLLFLLHSLFPEKVRSPSLTNDGKKKSGFLSLKAEKQNSKKKSNGMKKESLRCFSIEPQALYPLPSFLRTLLRGEKLLDSGVRRCVIGTVGSSHPTKPAFASFFFFSVSSPGLFAVDSVSLSLLLSARGNGR
jgi:hypothetical protein